MILRGNHPAVRGEVEVTIPDNSDLAHAMRAGTLHGVSIAIPVTPIPEEPSTMSRLSHDRPDDHEQVVDDAIEHADSDRGYEQ